MSIKRITLFVLVFLWGHLVHATCDIRPWAAYDIRMLHGAMRTDMKKPRLVIDRKHLEEVSDTVAEPYGIGVPRKPYYVGAYTEGRKITVYQQVFQKHLTCDEAVRSKLRGMLAHEYTHYLDSDGVISRLIGTDNEEQVAIIGEHYFATLAWPGTETRFTRPLTSDEDIQLKTLRREFKPYEQ